MTSETNPRTFLEVAEAAVASGEDPYINLDAQAVENDLQDAASESQNPYGPELPVGLDYNRIDWAAVGAARVAAIVERATQQPYDPERQERIKRLFEIRHKRRLRG